MTKNTEKTLKTKPILINFHMHSTGSDGRMKPEEVVKEAIAAGIDFMCFTDHNHRIPWGEPFFSKSYVKDVREMQKKYKDQIDISFGIEIDWVEGSETLIKKQASEFEFDYVMGSTHLLKDSNNVNFGVNFDKEIFFRQIKEKGINTLIKEYYSQSRLLANSKIFDSMAHFDLIKTFNKNHILFNEEDAFYREEVLKTLDEIKKADMALEINTGGLIYDCKSMYPSLWILKEARKRKIPLTIGADTHWAERIDAGLKEAYNLAKEAGYSEIVRFKARKRISIPI